jgi:transcriptional regulator with XRE-family HTH domain
MLRPTAEGEEVSQLGDVLLAGRQAASLSLREVQRRTGIHNAHLSQIEKGHIERPEVGLLFQLAELYGLDFGRLIELSGHLAGEDTGGAQRAVTAAALRAVGGIAPARQAEALSLLQRLARPPRPLEPDLSEAARGRVAAVAERALEWAGVVDVVPTPLDQVATAVGITEVKEAAELPAEVVAHKPRVWKRVLGAIVFPAKTIYIDRQSQIQPRANFTQAHETAHMLLPWHETAFRIDDEKQLFYGTRDELELEANYAAAHLIFQGHRYHERALQNEVSIATPIDLARQYGASLHASIRFYVERHPDPVAVLVAGRYTQFDGTLPIWTSFESKAFLERFGRFADQLPGAGLPVVEPDLPLGQIAATVREAEGVVSDTITLIDFHGDARRFVAEGFFNRYSVFIMVSPYRRIKTGRRVQISTEGAVG